MKNAEQMSDFELAAFMERCEAFEKDQELMKLFEAKFFEVAEEVADETGCSIYEATGFVVETIGEHFKGQGPSYEEAKEESFRRLQAQNED